MTLVGIGLTAWLLPAFTRQWDDRQKAHELKTSLVTGMTAATAAVIVKSREAIEGSPTDTVEPLSQISEAWQLASIQIEERFRSYLYGSGITDTWHNYSTLVNYTLARLMGRTAEAKGLHPAAVILIARIKRQQAARNFIASIDFVSDTSKDSLSRSLKYADIQQTLLTIEEIVAVRVLAAHPSGYSTSFHDFIRDLIP